VRPQLCGNQAIARAKVCNARLIVISHGAPCGANHVGCIEPVCVLKEASKETFEHYISIPLPAGTAVVLAPAPAVTAAAIHKIMRLALFRSSGAA
jgi:hypothetical protein